jgi:hypothetical protein
MATDNTKPAAPAAAPDAYDTMSSAFDELLVPEPTPTPPEGSTSEVDAAAASSKEPPAEGEQAPAAGEGAQPPAAGEGEQPPAGDGKPAEPTPPEKPEGGADAAANEDWKARFEELEARVKAQAPATPPEKPPVETPPKDERPTYSAEEQEFLTKYDADWPDIARGEMLKRRSEYMQLVDYVFKEVARVYGPMVEQGARAAETVAETTTLAAIHRVHSDYDDAMYEEVVRWADGLTGMRQRIAQTIIEEGSPQEVVDLLTEFKSATGRSKPKVVAGDAAPAAPAAKVVTELSATAKQAARALGVVDSKRSVVSSQGADPADFEAAWEEAVGK